MAEEELNIFLRAVDQASKIFKGVSSSAEELESELHQVDSIDPTISIDDSQVDNAQAELDTLEQTTVSPKVLPVDDDQAEEANAELDALDQQTISPKVVPVDDDQIEKASAGLDGLNSKLMGVAGAIGLADQATKLWDASTQRQTTQFYLGANLGEKKAREMQLAIQDIVATVPGDDTFMNTVLSGAMAKQTNLTTSELERGASAMADYIAGSEMQGKNALEAQQDLKSYILSGSTAELQRSSILSNQVDILEGKATVQERINALIEAENNEQVAGLSGYDTAANKMTEFQGRIEKAQADLGEMFLPAIQGALDFGLALDDSLGGGVMATIAGLGAAIPAIVTGFSSIGQVATGVKALRDAYKGLAITETLVNAIEGEGVIARIASALGITTTAAAADGAAISFGGLAIAEGAALWPILAIVAALALLGVAVYEVGKYFGWWTDVGSMIDAIWAGIQRLWDAFINHPDVQGFLTMMSQAWNMVSSALGQVVSWVMSFFNQSSPGNFDIVRALINAVGIAWQAMTTPIRLVITVVRQLWTAIVTWYTVTRANVQRVQALFRALPGWIRSAISTLVSIITAPFKSAYNGVKSVVDSIKSVMRSIGNISLSSITDAITKPFRDAYDAVCGWVDKIKQKAQEAVEDSPLGFAFGGAELAYGGLDLLDTTSNTRTSQDITLTLDFKNVPAGMSEETLRGALIQSFQDKTVLNALTSNKDFQSLDNKYKGRISMKSNRARGV